MTTRIPSRDEILQWISDNPGQTGKRDIARAFGIKGAARSDLKRLLRELEDEGHLPRRSRSRREPGTLPPVAVLEITGPDSDGDLFARPRQWQGEGAPPRILILEKTGDPALKRGDRVLARLQAVSGEDHAYQARLIRRLAAGPQRLLGIFRKHAEGGRIVPIDKGAEREWLVAPGDENGARDGELVEARQTGPRDRFGLPRARVTDRLGDPTQPRAISLIAIHQHNIPDRFPEEVLAEAEALAPAGLDSREDLRHLPLVTIDPADARDHDDAICAAPDDDPANPGGHVLWVAIADVAHYVRPGTALDREARKRGNSTYFPDRVVPMLPERLSGDLCSLHEGEDRPVIAVRLVLNARGEKIAHRFTRAFMRSRASLTYREVQAARDGEASEKCAPLMGTIDALYAAYEALRQARARRQPLDLDLPERRIVLSEDGRVESVRLAERLDAHRLVEECMILANVAAAEELNRLGRPLLFRVHEEPSPEKLDALREVAEASGFTLARGQVLKTRHLNQLLAQAAGSEFDELINLSTLRAMQTAYYDKRNFGHFGLALRNYAHFTSPIRRYADLIVHRALIAGHGWGADGLSAEDVERLEATAEHISDTERRSMMAERDTNDRYLAAWLAERVGAEFTGRISGVTRFGVFVKLDESGADGLVPVASLGGEYFRFDRDSQELRGEESGLTLSVGLPVGVRLAEATPVTGGLILELLSIDGKGLPRGRGRGRGGARKGARRKASRARAKAAKARKKAKRSRK